MISTEASSPKITEESIYQAIADVLDPNWMNHWSDSVSLTAWR
jgi:hypothetical protein